MKKQNGVYLFTQEEIQNILNLYCEDSLSMSKIAKSLKVDVSVVKKILKDNNILIRNNNCYKQKFFIVDYFKNIDTEEKAYWLGFIYADGCISKNTFEIKLSITDIQHLYKLKDCLKSKHKIYQGIAKSSFGISKYCGFSITNKNLVNNLLSQGVFYNKSKTLEPPTINSKYIPAFIRGYFDGDGSVYEFHKIHEGSVSFIGTYKMLHWILENMKSCVNTKANIYKYKNKDIYEFKIGGKNHFVQCYNYLYKDATVYLDRKKQKFEYILNVNQIDVQRL